jgi:hypothetical protein
VGLALRLDPQESRRAGKADIAACGSPWSIIAKYLSAAILHIQKVFWIADLPELSFNATRFASKISASREEGPSHRHSSETWTRDATMPGNSGTRFRPKIADGLASALCTKYRRGSFDLTKEFLCPHLPVVSAAVIVLQG